MKIVHLRGEKFREWRDSPGNRDAMCAELMRHHGDCQVRSPQGRILKFCRVPLEKDRKNQSPGAPPGVLRGKENYIKASNSCCEYLGKLEDGKHHAVCSNYVDTSGPVLVELSSGRVLRPAMPDEIEASQEAFKIDGVGEIKIGEQSCYVDNMGETDE